MRRTLLTLSGVLIGLVPATAPAAEPDDPAVAAVERAAENTGHQLDVLAKLVDDVLWYQRVGDVAVVEKARIFGPPRWKEDNPTGIGAGNHLKFYTYLFTPKGFDGAAKLPLLVLPHGGVHADFTTYYAHIVRELLAQGYIVVAPEYRGSTGYGRGMYEDIDYGGLEVDDVVAARDWAVENLESVDGRRVGIMGWSHGGMIALLSVFDHPTKFTVAYAGVPVSDIVARMGYQTESYRALFSAEYHIGQSAYENVDEYRRRSPAWNAHKLQTPLLVHTTTNDRDVNVIEVEHLIKSLKAENKKFEYKIYEDFPGGHSLNRTDSALARQSRREVYDFLRRHLRK